MAGAAVDQDIVDIIGLTKRTPSVGRFMVFARGEGFWQAGPSP